MRMPSLSLFFTVMFLALFASNVFATLTGYMDFVYSDSIIKTEDPQGEESRIKLQSFSQSLSLNLEMRPFPKLRFLATGNLRQYVTEGSINDDEISQRTQILNPFLQLSLEDPLYKASAGYFRRDQIFKVSGSPDRHFVNEQWLGNIYLTPVELPSLWINTVRTSIYDVDRSLIDTVDDLLSLTSEYRWNDLYLRYYGTYDKVENRIEDQQTRALSNAIEVRYDKRFFDNMVIFSSGYLATFRETEITGKGKQFVLISILPFAGLSVIDDTPLDGALEQNSLLIDGNNGATAGIDIGTGGPGAPRRTWNMGIDFFTEQEVDTIYVWVDRELPSDISGAFSWQVYVSRDNITWTLAESNPAVKFGILQNRFEIQFPLQKTRFIKVVTTSLSATVPVPPGFEVTNIFVTEIEAFRSQPGKEGVLEISDESHRINFYGRINILKTPVLYYDVGYTSLITRGTSRPTLITWNLLNALNLSHSFSPIFATSARIQREDSDSAEGDVQAIAYTISFNALPSRTLNHTLTFSGRFEENPSGHLKRNGVYLYNTMELYRGINLLASAGAVFSTLETGQEQVSPSYNFGAEIHPKDYLTILLNYTSTETKITGGGMPEVKTFSRRSEATLSYYPFQALYISASLGHVSQTERDYTFHNYSINWRPFPAGQLLVSINYNEDFRSDINERVKSFSPNVRWNFGRSSWLNISYTIIKAESDVTETDQRTFTANLRIGF